MRLATALLPLLRISTNVRFHDGRRPAPLTPQPARPSTGAPARAAADALPCRQCRRLIAEPWDASDPTLCAQCSVDRFFFDREARWAQAPVGPVARDPARGPAAAA
jgi:hypothetical protein